LAAWKVDFLRWICYTESWFFRYICHIFGKKEILGIAETIVV